MTLIGMTETVDDRLPGLPIWYATTELDQPDSMLVLMPAALSPSRADRTRVHYTRWSWHSSWPTTQVLSIADPALQQSPVLNGAWFIHPRFDVTAAIAGLAADRAAEKGIPADRVVFYGSSLGGFGAIACAAHFVGARAVAEVPQIDFEHWQPLATQMVEEHALGKPFAEFRAEFPERVDLAARLRFAGLVPPITIISNTGDKSYQDQTGFIEWCQGVDLPRLGAQELVTTTLVDGHRVLQKDDIMEWLQP